jgi:hypothetical protein
MILPKEMNAVHFRPMSAVSQSFYVRGDTYSNFGVSVLFRIRQEMFASRELRAKGKERRAKSKERFALALCPLLFALDA